MRHDRHLEEPPEHPDDCVCRECRAFGPPDYPDHPDDCEGCDYCRACAPDEPEPRMANGHHPTCDCEPCKLERYGSPHEPPPDEPPRPDDSEPPPDIVALGPEAIAGWCAERAAAEEEWGPGEPFAPDPRGD